MKQTENCKKITVFGMSMGSIVALGTAIYCDSVDNLVMMSPSHVAFEGVSKDRKTMRGRSFLIVNGKDIPYVSPDFSWPSAYSVQLLYNCLEKSGFTYEYKKILYPEYGHMLPLKKDVMKRVYSWLKKD